MLLTQSAMPALQKVFLTYLIKLSYLSHNTLKKLCLNYDLKLPTVPGNK